MRFTVRFCHLELISNMPKGSIIYPDKPIGVMGSTGSSSAPHVHTDCVMGFLPRVYRLHEIDFDIDTIKQLTYFIDDELFKTKLLITSYFGDPDYKNSEGEWVFHPAYDVVPLNRHKSKSNYTLYWNRSMPGIILSTGFDNGYGNYVNIGFEV